MSPIDPMFSTAMGEFAIYRGIQYRSVGSSEGNRRILFDDAATYDAFPDDDVVRRIPHRPGARRWMLDIPDGALEGVYFRSVVAAWFGEPVTINGPPDGATGTVEIRYTRSPEFAVATHMSGDQYSGWVTRVEATELENVRVVDRPMPLLGAR